MSGNISTYAIIDGKLAKFEVTDEGSGYAGAIKAVKKHSGVARALCVVGRVQVEPETVKELNEQTPN